jgi:protein phosphatase 1 regulatory subunit 32
MPHHRPLLHKLRRKDPVELENSGYVRWAASVYWFLNQFLSYSVQGPGYMTTETHERFRGAQPHLDVSKRSIGPKEGSGFTHADNMEPVTYHPGYAHKGDVPVWTIEATILKHALRDCFIAGIPHRSTYWSEHHENRLSSIRVFRCKF